MADISMLIDILVIVLAVVVLVLNLNADKMAQKRAANANDVERIKKEIKSKSSILATVIIVIFVVRLILFKE